MAVVRNLMIRIGADYSPAKKGMDGATRELTRFRRDTERTTRTIRGQKGLGGITTQYRQLGRDVAASLSRLRGARGIGGVASELRTLVPLLGRSAAGLRGVGSAAGGAGLRLLRFAGPAGIATAALSALAGVSAAASQEAIRYEATIGRLNMQLREGSRDFMDWARSMGLAKQTAADLGATYGTLLSSFIRDNQELQAQTKAITQATRVTASATGRSVEDVLERMRSGLLGNTEAIEDLGIFVNVSMIESTQAFRKFAGDKSWAQLDFQMQQQIRLAAILEQAYARYGDQLQNNTMTKQEHLLEQLKDIKLNLSQAFLPIYDSVLPALTRMAERVADVTEQIARFIYSLRGWDYDEMTRGTDQQTGAVEGQAGAYDDLAKSAAKARGELAGFDELNLIGDPGAGSGTGGSGSGGSAGGPPIPAGPHTLKVGFEWDIPPLPKIPPIQIPPPQPPDAGMGAVATAVVGTVNGMTAQSAAGFARMALDWQLSLRGMDGDLSIYRPRLEGGWSALMDKIGTIKMPLADVRLEWHGTLDYMLSQLNAFRPYIEWGWHLIAAAVRKPIPPLTDLKTAWNTALDDMLSTLSARVSSMVAELARLRAEAAKPIPQPSTQPQRAPVAAGQGAGRSTVLTGQPAEVPKEAFVSSLYTGLAGAFSSERMAQIRSLIAAEAAKPQNKTAFQVYTSLVGGGQLAKIGAGAVGKVKSIWESLKGVGSAIPAFASGAAVFGPTLAMVGDNPGARHDPEIAAPQSFIEDAVSSGSAEVVDVLLRILSAVERGQQVNVTIAEGDVGRAATNYIRGESRRGRNPLTGV